ncbi:unnamed protein product, partial [Amoebophrya sp. A25]
SNAVTAASKKLPNAGASRSSSSTGAAAVAATSSAAPTAAQAAQADSSRPKKPAASYITAGHIGNVRHGGKQICSMDVSKARGVPE